MKRVALYLFTAAIAVSVLSCAKDVPAPGSAALEGTTLTAVMEQAQGTRAVLSGRSVMWEGGDSIKVYLGGDGHKFHSTLEEPAAVSQFYSKDTFTPQQGQYFVAVYPYPAATRYYGEALTITVPAWQTAVSGSFDREAFVMVAKSTGNTLSFRNLCGGLKVSVTHPGVSRIVLRSNGGEFIAGKTLVGFSEEGIPLAGVPEIQEGSTKIELEAPRGTTFGVGENYYIAAFPRVLSKGFTLDFLSPDGELVQGARRTVNTPVEIKRSVWGTAPNADEGLDYTLVSATDSTILYKSIDGSPISPDGIGIKRTYVNERGYRVMVLESIITTLPMQAFRGNTALKEIILPSTVTSLESRAFEGCTSLERAVMPDAVSVIGPSAFLGCSSLKGISFPKGLVTIGSDAFSGCSSIEKLSIPSFIENIGSNAFAGCTGLLSLEIGGPIKTISLGVLFPDSALLGKVTVYADVPALCKYAMRGFSSLALVEVLANEPPAGAKGMFDGNAPGRVIKVPAGTKETYSSAPYWEDYATYITE